MTLVEQRRALQAVILKRIYRLRFEGTPPHSFIHGAYYIEDPKRVECQIICLATFFGQIAAFDFWLNGANISVYQYGSNLVFRVSKKIPERLWDDVRWFSHGETHIIGYLRSYLPSVNRNILEQRYLSGHIMNQTISLVDLHNITISVKQRLVRISWPIGISRFPRNFEYKNELSTIYIRDFIDACQSFFRSEYEDCIRRVVTSAENFFSEKKWVGRPERFREIVRRVVRRRKRPSPKSFRRILAHNLSRGRTSDEVIRDNMAFIYSVRNKIVHDGFRMSTSCSMFCYKSIGTLSYLLGWYCNNKSVSKYILYLQMQFIMQNQFFGQYADLDEIKKINTQLNELKQKPVESDEEFNHFVFSALRFSPTDKASI